MGTACALSYHSCACHTTVLQPYSRMLCTLCAKKTRLLFYKQVIFIVPQVLVFAGWEVYTAYCTQTTSVSIQYCTVYVSCGYEVQHVPPGQACYIACSVVSWVLVGICVQLLPNGSLPPVTNRCGLMGSTAMALMLTLALPRGDRS